tara:strand:+ start:227 stop:598 length:372 start_codon:yes stop_codon:yes gene_type:complete
MKSLLFEVLNKATKNNMEFLICDNEDGIIFMSQREKATEKDIRKMYDTYDIGECFILFPNNNIKVKEIEKEVVDLNHFNGKHILWTELNGEKENRISDGSSSLWEILGLDKLSDKWANFYKYL